MKAKSEQYPLFIGQGIPNRNNILNFEFLCEKLMNFSRFLHQQILKYCIYLDRFVEINEGMGAVQSV